MYNLSALPVARPDPLNSALDMGLLKIWQRVNSQLTPGLDCNPASAAWDPLTEAGYTDDVHCLFGEIRFCVWRVAAQDREAVFHPLQRYYQQEETLLSKIRDKTARSYLSLLKIATPQFCGSPNPELDRLKAEDRTFLQHIDHHLEDARVALETIHILLQPPTAKIYNLNLPSPR